MILTGYIITYLYLFTLLLMTYIGYKVFKIRMVILRKLAHIMIAFIWVISYYYFGTTWHMLVVPISFVVVNFIGYHLSLFKWLDDKESKGTLYYPISVLILAIITYFHPEFYYAYGIGIFCLGLGDGFAPLVAGYLKSRKIVDNKTLTGTLTVLIMSLVVVVSFNTFFDLGFNIIKILMICLLATVLELFAKKGLDNLYIPLGVAALVYLLGVI